MSNKIYRMETHKKRARRSSVLRLPKSLKPRASDAPETGRAKKQYAERASTRDKKAQVLASLKGSMGILSPALASAGVTRKMHSEWMRKDPKYAEAVNEIAEVALDYVETQHYLNIKNGNVVSIIYHLKTKGRHRGYSEHLTIGNDQEAPFGTPALAALSVAALEKLLSQLTDGGSETV